MTDGPLIVQSDKTVLLEVDHPQAAEARQAIAPFAELERSPEHIHTYRLTPLGLWNARAAGHDAEQVVDALVRFSPVHRPARAAGRRGRHDGPLRPAAVGQAIPMHGLVLISASTAPCSKRCCGKKKIGTDARASGIDDDTVRGASPPSAGRLKQALLKVGWPAEDLAGYVDGEAHADRPAQRRRMGRCATTNSRRSIQLLGTVARESWCCRAAPARPWSARRRWRRPSPRPR